MTSRIIFLMGNVNEHTVNTVSGMKFQVEKLLGTLYQIQDCMWNELKYSLDINKDIQEKLLNKLQEIYKNQPDIFVELVFLND